MNILAIETSSTWGSVALSKDSVIVYNSYLDIRITHSERLLPQIDDALHKTGMQIGDLDLIAVSNGPGSFTGVRIGLAAAKGLCIGTQIPLLPVNTLRLMAYNLYNSQNAVMPVIDARMGEIYGALYSGDMKELIAPCNMKPDKFFELIKQEVIAIGSGVSKYEHMMNDIKFHKALLHQQNPQAEVLISIAVKEALDLKYDLNDISMIEPYYLRKSQAEIAKQNKKEN